MSKNENAAFVHNKPPTAPVADAAALGMCVAGGPAHSWVLTHCAVSVFLLEQLAVLDPLKELKSTLASFSKLQNTATEQSRDNEAVGCENIRVGIPVSTVSFGIVNSLVQLTHLRARRQPCDPGADRHA